MHPGSSQLLEALLAEIRHGGPLSFSRFQEMALYHPSWGYYTRDRAPGKEGADFWTSPEIDPAFGELVGRQISQMASKLQVDTGFQVVEYGAGTGRLAASLLDSWRREESSLYRPGAYCIIEISPALVSLQRKTLADHLEVVSWDRAESRPVAASPGVILMNEVLDALPVDRTVGSGQGLDEIRVGEDGSRLVEVRVPAAPDLVAQVESRLPAGTSRLPEGHEFEVCGRLPVFLSAAAEKISAGYLLIVDYGHTSAERLHPSRSRGTVMGYAGHRAIEALLENPGQMDLTAHVDLDALGEVAAAAGFTPSRWTTQMKFLLALGLGEMMESLEEQDLAEAERVRRRLALASLVRPGGMGEMFKVFIAGRHAPMDLVGLQSPWSSASGVSA